MDVTLVLTHDCNLGCGYCYAGAKLNKRMSSETATKVVDLAFSDGSPRVNISFFGGEPLLTYDQLVASATYAHTLANERGVEVRMTVTTNGTLLDTARAKELHELGVYIALSIDGTREAHDAGRPKMGGGSSFDDVARGLGVLVDRGVPFETISVVTPQNAHLLGESVKFLFDAGVPRIDLNPCYEAVFQDEDLERYGKSLEQAGDAMMEWYRKGRIVSISVFDNKIIAAIKGGLAEGDKCSLGVSAIAVAPSGNIYSCERLVVEDENADDVMGHIDTWKPVHEHACARGPVNPECAPCGERWRCSSFCACANRAETGRSDIAGGTQCWHERFTAKVADRIAETMWAEQNEAFIAWFYGRALAGPALSEPTPEHTRGGATGEIARTPRAPITGRKKLNVVIG